MALSFILITIDCLRFDRLGPVTVDASHSSLTPHINALARGGLSFSQISSGGCWTQATFPVLFTSTYPSMYNGCLGPLAPERPNLVRILRARGYHTMAVVSSPLLGRRYGYDQGFSTFEELRPRRDAPQWYSCKGVQRLLRNRLFDRVLMEAGIEIRPAPAYALADQVTNRALDFIGSADRPYFLWLHYMDAHWPYHLDRKLRTAEQIACAWNDRYLARLASRDRGSKHPGHDRLQRWTNLYDECITRIDDQLDRLLAHAEVRKDTPTCVVITADHGEEFFEHGSFGHGAASLYQEILHVPLIMSWPSAPRGRVVTSPGSLIDVAPTILDLAGESKPREMLGESLLPMRGKNWSSGNRPTIAEGWWGPDSHVIAISAQGYKFIVNAAHRDNHELYDLRKDPGESDNLRCKAPDREQYFRDLLSRHLSTVRETQRDRGAAPETSAEILERLRALGYVD